jgi:hypothetical protein
MNVRNDVRLPERKSANRPTAVDKALTVLAALAEHDAGIGVSELARAIGMSKSTTFRLFGSLERTVSLNERGAATGWACGCSTSAATSMARNRRCCAIGYCLSWPTCIDDVMLPHPEVSEAATIGVPDERKGERPVTFFVPAPGTDPDIAELEAHCAGNLAAYKRPARIVALPSLPRTPASKIDRITLRRRWNEESTASVPGAGLSDGTSRPSREAAPAEGR